MIDSQSVDHQINHLFRQESGKMVAVLVNIFGSHHFELVEDVVQAALIKALENWKYNGIPENPKAWLYRVAKNHAIDIIRKETKTDLLDFSDPQQQLLTSGYTINNTMSTLWEEEQIQDDFLGMMFACCNPKINSESQTTFILKSLCGFSTKEIAKAFLCSEDIISKRIYRTKEYFRKNNIRPSAKNIDNIEDKINAVVNTIYLIFNEGYSATNSTEHIRKDLISQALYLAKELTNFPKTNVHQVNSLLALMCFHISRTDARLDKDGAIILLKNQNRKLWNTEMINAGEYYLSEANKSTNISINHIEALISREHCITAAYEETNWNNILAYYDLMLRHKFDPILYLNKTIVLIEAKGPQHALESLSKIENEKEIQKYYLYHAVLGEIHQQLNNFPQAISSFEQAKKLTQSKTEQKLLLNKINNIS